MPVSRGLLLAATPAELAGAVVTAQAARAGRVEPLGMVRAPLDVVCQQLIGMACAGEQVADEAFDLIRRAGPMAEPDAGGFRRLPRLPRRRAGAPAGAFEPEPDAAALDFAADLETERPVRPPQPPGRPLVLEQRRDDQLGGVGSRHGDGRRDRHARGRVRRAAHPGDRFVLDGRASSSADSSTSTLLARSARASRACRAGRARRQSLSPELARELAGFRAEAGQRLIDGPPPLRSLAQSKPLSSTTKPQPF